ncbi:MAG TPA: M1 family aminopeptidase, partial [Chitinophagales bacterium]|nr:M1 family aminopeptidase [Chitinophagales bacterium]
MFLHIFNYELKYWFRNPSVYIYSIAFLLMATGTMAGYAGAFGKESIALVRMANSPLNIFSLVIFFNKLLLLLLPSIIGNAVYRDFRYNTHTILYSFPFTKAAYLSAKFLSAFIVVCVVALMIAFGCFIGTQVPGVNSLFILPFDFGVYLHACLFYLLPNLLLFGSIVFGITAISRNSYAGFIAILVLLIAREALNKLTGGSQSSSIIFILDPFGESAINFFTRNLTVMEEGLLPLPSEWIIVYNRLFWIAITIIVSTLFYKWFSFSRPAFSFQLKGNANARNTKENFENIVKVQLGKVRLRFTFIDQLKAAWKLSGTDFKFIVTNGSFIVVFIAASLLTFILLLQMNPQYETRILPVTWVMLAFPVFFFSLFINLMTFLYAGILVHRAKASRIHELIDASPVSNWVLLLSKFIALLKLQVLLLSIIMVAGILVQAYNSYYHFEIGHYLFDLFAIHLVGFVIWSFAALFIQIVFTNSYLGLFLLVLFSFGMTELPQLGVESVVFRFNQNPEPDFFLKYSDLSGYGYVLTPYFIYKIYWSLFACLLFLFSLLFWPRGLLQSSKERVSLALSAFRNRVAFSMVAFFLLFLIMGWNIYREENSADKILTEQEMNAAIVAADRKYTAFSKAIQPRITAVKVSMNIFPESLSFKADGLYKVSNQSNRVIDTLLINYAFDVKTKYSINRSNRILSRDTIGHFDILLLKNSLHPGDSLELSFEVENIDNTLLFKNSMVEKEGTYITSAIFPGLGYRKNASNADPLDSFALRNHYRSIDADHIDFEATVSTIDGQIAIAPGYLKKEWSENGRRYFIYKSEGKVTNDFSFNSGSYEIARDRWKNIDLEIYYHKDHHYNLDHLMKGMKATLAYCEENFSPYQHKHIRIVEYSRTQGNFAQSFANTIPFSETGFIMDIDHAGKNGLNLPFLGAAHELAHQWWGHQVTPADVLGCRMVTESMAEYVSLKVLEEEYGKHQLLQFVKKALDIYGRRRIDDTDGEKPLLFNTGLNHSYVPYQKGLLVLYAMSEYIGEVQLNQALRSYLEKVKFQDAPYTTSIEMVDYIRKATPDSLQYLIRDLFETVTLYDNKILSSKVKAISNGKYEIEIKFAMTKYNVDEKGKRIYEDPLGRSLTYQSPEFKEPFNSLPLTGYIEIGVFTAGNDRECCLYEIKASEIYN